MSFTLCESEGLQVIFRELNRKESKKTPIFGQKLFKYSSYTARMPKFKSFNHFETLRNSGIVLKKGFNELRNSCIKRKMKFYKKAQQVS